ncbi:uncharacterized protein A4U43_C04F7920 [Asparagus officinalis]|uniref:Uncharacterized protein n=1 Tax=Asparagus officinalis TaxID=4686 RepID=A0A5P1F1T7_ASPOF|nr:uncharacterized protein A4U43_C04F7920 [Asparagus officinalis]
MLCRACARRKGRRWSMMPKGGAEFALERPRVCEEVSSSLRHARANGGEQFLAVDARGQMGGDGSLGALARGQMGARASQMSSELVLGRRGTGANGAACRGQRGQLGFFYPIRNEQLLSHRIKKSIKIRERKRVLRIEEHINHDREHVPLILGGDGGLFAGVPRRGAGVGQDSKGGTEFLGGRQGAVGGEQFLGGRARGQMGGERFLGGRARGQMGGERFLRRPCTGRRAKWAPAVHGAKCGCTGRMGQMGVSGFLGGTVPRPKWAAVMRQMVGSKYNRFRIGYSAGVVRTPLSIPVYIPPRHTITGQYGPV